MTSNDEANVPLVSTIGPECVARITVIFERLLRSTNLVAKARVGGSKSVMANASEINPGANRNTPAARMQTPCTICVDGSSPR
jgi:hypothetical protein